MSQSYVPRAGSVSARVIEFLTQNPDEELGRQDIAVKFDCQAQSVDTYLAAAVKAGVLVRTQNEDSGLVWCLASNTQGRKPIETPTLVPVPEDIKVRKGVGLKAPGELLRERWDALFLTFEVGDSAEFDSAWTPTLKTEARRFCRGRNARFIFLPTGAGKMGMERRK